MKTEPQMKNLLAEVKKQSKKEEVVIVMCECAYGDTPIELQLMAKSIKDIVKAGGIVHIIK